MVKKARLLMIIFGLVLTLQSQGVLAESTPIVPTSGSTTAESSGLCPALQRSDAWSVQCRLINRQETFQTSCWPGGALTLFLSGVEQYQVAGSPSGPYDTQSTTLVGVVGLNVTNKTQAFVVTRTVTKATLQVPAIFDITVTTITGNGLQWSLTQVSGFTDAGGGNYVPITPSSIETCDYHP